MPTPPLPLFAYGTLRDVDYQRELFGRTYYMQRAWVSGFAVRTTPTGYLAATRQRGATIDGAVVEVDAAGLAVADAWEDLTVYERIVVVAKRSDGAQVRCSMYVVANAVGAAVADGRAADRTRAEVIADIRRFRELWLNRGR